MSREKAERKSQEYVDKMLTINKENALRNEKRKCLGARLIKCLSTQTNPSTTKQEICKK